MRFHPHLLVLLFLAFLVAAPTQSLGQSSVPQVPLKPEVSEPDEQVAKMQKEMAKKANKERQEQLKRDTDKLLQLATELKQYVDKTNENVLSLDVVKKAEEIEKLAHSVKEKMRAGQ